MSNSETPWQVYETPIGGRCLLFLVRMGLARGGIGRLIRKLWKKRYGSVIDANVRGIKFRLNFADNATDEKLFLSSKVYDETELDALCSGGRSVFVDVGANIGYYSLSAAQRGFKKVLAIEPNPVTVSRLSFNVSINPWHDRIAVIPLAVGSGGQIPFYSSGSLGDASVLPQDGVTPILVDSKPLLDILRENSVQSVDAMKVDVEGYEDHALLPFFLQAPRTLWPRMIVLEDSHQDKWKEPVITRLLALGYQVKQRTRGNHILQLP